MLEVEITNFESIRHASFVIDGFTTIVGRNFIGKSSILRAINAALTNASGTNFITWGENFSEIKIKSENISILWHKEDGNNFYKVNGKKRSKVGRDKPPEEIAEAGLGTVPLGKDEVNIAYVEQFFPLFLVDKQDSKGIDLLTAAYGLDRLYKAVDLCNKDQRSNKDLLRVRNKDLEVLNKEMKKFEGLEDILTKKSNIIKTKKYIEAERVKIDKLKDKFELMKVLSSQVKSMGKIKVVKIPHVAVIRDEINKMDKLSSLNEGMTILAVSLKQIKDIHDIEIPSGIEKLKKSKSDLKGIVDSYRNLQTLKSSVNSLKHIEEISIPKMIDLKFEDFNNLVKVRDQIKSLTISCKQIQEEHSKLNKDLEILAQEKEAFKGVCPLCGNKINI